MSQVNANVAGVLTPEQARRLVELSEENVGLENRRTEVLREMQSILTGNSPPPSGGTPLPAPAPAPKPASKPAPQAVTDGQPQVRRGPGRPPGSKNKPKTDEGAKEAAQTAAPTKAKQPNLPNLLRDIADKNRKSLTVDDFVRFANDANYQSGAKDFGNMVYQALQGLVKKGSLKKSVVQEDNGSEKRVYNFVAA